MKKHYMRRRNVSVTRSAAAKREYPTGGVRATEYAAGLWDWRHFYIKG
jgi:hypothetical protein